MSLDDQAPAAAPHCRGVEETVDRNDVLRELAGICRQSEGAALWALGFLAQGAEPQVLRECLEGAREARQTWPGRRAGHLEAYRERWGRLPDEH